MRSVPAGTATLGADVDEIAFGWDNDSDVQRGRCRRIRHRGYPVTNAIGAVSSPTGGPIPVFWRERDGAWLLRLQFEEIPLPGSWPAYVTNDQARAYAAWRGMRLPTEAEYHRAAFGSPSGEERAFPWGAAAPAAEHGNFDFARFDPASGRRTSRRNERVGRRRSVGNGWEWTSTPFAPLPGFEPMASYPQYSADFFDGKHYVMKGASPVTPRELIRRSFRNWFYGDYPYMYAKFRCVA